MVDGARAASLFNGLLECCNTAEFGHSAELRVVHLSSDVTNSEHLNRDGHQDDWDLTPSSRNGSEAPSSCRRGHNMTPRQGILRDQIWLPRLRRYPVPPSCLPGDSEEVRKESLTELFKDFVMDLYQGLHMTHLTANQEIVTVSCHLLEDLETLQIDQGSGCIIEFPLISVSKVYRILKPDESWYSGGSSPSGAEPSNAEHIVVMEFMKRKLPFVFTDMESAQTFLICIELLIRRAQELRRDSEVPPSGASHAEGRRKLVSPLFPVVDSSPAQKARQSGERIGKSLLPLSLSPKAPHHQEFVSAERTSLRGRRQ